MRPTPLRGVEGGFDVMIDVVIHYVQNKPQLRCVTNLGTVEVW